MKLFYQQFINTGDLCFDVGANLGNRSHVFLELGARVVSVEPHPLCFKRLNEKFSKNERIMLEPIGISDSQKSEIFYLSNISDVSTFSQEFIEAYSGQKGLEWKERITVDVNTLDYLIAKHGVPNFMKLDIEGYEEKALSTLRHQVPIISFEYNNKLIQTALNCISILSKLGPYTFRFSPYESWRFYDEKWLNEHEMKNQLNSIQDNILTGDIYAKLI